jgi:RNA polymerase sigma factor (sigma-70 family)
MDENSSARVGHLVDHLFRHESGRMVSVLTKMLGIKNLDTAHDIVQDTLLKAMTLWPYGGIPNNPPAWLYAVAKNKAIDFLRAQKRTRNIDEISIDRQSSAESGSIDSMFVEDAIQDSQLRMIFACCHPTIPEESQIALSLKTLCGLSVSEIAKAFLTSDDTIAKRIYRAKEKIHQERIEMEVPSASSLHTRLEIVLNVLYLLFNEGYNSSHPDRLIREDICAEAMRLCHLLTLHPATNQPISNALLALMCFQSSRLRSRIDEKGNIITLKYQNRQTWNHALIQKGRDYLDRAAEDNIVSVYHLEAGIAALHAFAPSFEQTDWQSVYHLYEVLYSIKPGPVIALNKAIASSYAISNESALELLNKIKGLEKHYLYHAALGEVYFALNRKAEAKQHFERAASLTMSKTEQQFLTDKLETCMD